MASATSVTPVASPTKVGTPSNESSSSCLPLLAWNRDSASCSSDRIETPHTPLDMTAPWNAALRWTESNASTGSRETEVNAFAVSVTVCPLGSNVVAMVTPVAKRLTMRRYSSALIATSPTYATPAGGSGRAIGVRSARQHRAPAPRRPHEEGRNAERGHADEQVDQRQRGAGQHDVALGRAGGERQDDDRPSDQRGERARTAPGEQQSGDDRQRVQHQRQEQADGQ